MAALLPTALPVDIWAKITHMACMMELKDRFQAMDERRVLIRQMIRMVAIAKRNAFYMKRFVQSELTTWGFGKSQYFVSCLTTLFDITTSDAKEQELYNMVKYTNRDFERVLQKMAMFYPGRIPTSDSWFY